MQDIKIINAAADNIQEFGMCGYKNVKQEGYRRKVEWLKQRFTEGMKYKVLYSGKDGAVGAIEYIPGEYAWRPIEAAGYLVIHCIFIIPRTYKTKGWGGLLVEECWQDAIKENKRGVAVVTRKGTWMVGKALFLKQGYETVDKAPPDYELLVKKINPSNPSPKFKDDWEKRLCRYSNGLVIITSDQCPYTTKAIKEIVATARIDYGLTPAIIELKNSRDAQNDSPCAFGSFCIVFRGKVIADHPISKTRFQNILNKPF
jgi:hypothetical protein